jgi:O-antigen ligase
MADGKPLQSFYLSFRPGVELTAGYMQARPGQVPGLNFIDLCTANESRPSNGRLEYKAKTFTCRLIIQANINNAMEIVVFVFGIAGLIWGLILLRRGGLLAGCLAVMLAGACFSVDFFKITIGPVPVTADRTLLVVLVGQYLLWRRWGWADPKPLGKAEVLLCLFTGMMVVSAFSVDYAYSNYQPLAWLIVYYLMPFCMYWIARQVELKEKSVSALFVCLTVFGSYLAVTSLAEYFEAWELVFPRYIAVSAASATAEFVGRARGPFLNPISNGMALSVCLGAALMLWPRLRRRGQLLMIPLYLLFVAAMYATMTRSVWLSGILTLAIVAGLAIPWNWRLPILGAGLLLAVLVGVAQWDRLVAFKRDRSLDAAQTAESAALRPILARIAWDMFLDHPLFGCGYTQYESQHPNYLSDRSTGLVLEKGRGYIPHNVVLSLLTETGLFGLGLFLAAVFFWARDAWLLWREHSAPIEARQQGLLMLAVLAIYFTNGMFHDVSAAPMANMTLFFLAGVTAGLRPWLKSTVSIPEQTRLVLCHV